ncbi:MAG: hypothetical protein ACPGVT_06535 [Maricaulaceae bacterium]
MSDEKKPSIFYWLLFWGLALLFLAWNAFGCYLYIMDQTMTDAAYIELYGADMANVRAKYPVWSTAAYATAVWGGLLAALMLILRKGLAVLLFVLSLVAAIVSFVWGLTNEEALAAAGETAWVMPAIVVGLGLFEVVWSAIQKRKGTIG